MERDGTPEVDETKQQHPDRNGSDVKKLYTMTAAVLVTLVTAVLGLMAVTPAYADSPPFKMVNYLTGRCLQVYPVDGDYTANNAPVVDDPCTGQAQELWVSRGTGSGWFQLINQRGGKCMDVEDGYEFDLAAIQQYACKPITGQNWKTMVNDPFAGGKALITQVRGNRDECVDVWYGRNYEHYQVVTVHCTSPNEAQTYLMVNVS